jgi:hypothetical protein
MTTKNNLSKEMESRLNNDIWDRDMARNVLGEISRRKKKRLSFLTGGLSIAAAVLVLAFSTGLFMPHEKTTGFHYLVTAQVNGTFQTVSGNTTESSSKNVELFYGETDSLIESSFAARYGSTTSQ